MEKEKHYWAFISYSHSDEKVAAWLHRSLESFRLPRKLVGTPGRNGIDLPRRLVPIFRDREELPSSSDLANTVTVALQRSRCLIVLCSPRSATSQWVNKEVETFKRLGRSDAILSLILEGEPNADSKPELGQPECFPLALKHPLNSDGALDLSRRSEPISADLRAGKDGRSNAFLKIVAGLVGVPFDALRQRERARRRRARIQLVVVSIALAGSIGVAWHWLEERKRVDRDSAAALTALAKADALLRSDDISPAVALLAFAARRAPSNKLILTRLMLALQQYNWPRPEAVIPTSGFASIKAFTDDLLVLMDVKNISTWNWRAQTPKGPPLRRGGGEFVLSPGGQVAYWTGNKHGILYSTITGEQLAQPFAIDTGCLGCGAFTPDESRLVTPERSGAFIRDGKTGQVRRGPLAFANGFHVQFSRDGSRLFLREANGPFRMFETETGRPLSPLRSEREFLALSPDARHFVADSSLWAWEGNQPLAPLLEPGYRLRSASFGPNNQELAVVDGRNRVALWTMDPLINETKAWNEKSEVQTITFSPDGARILLGFDQHLHLRHLSSLPAYPPFPANSAAVTFPAEFNSDGELLAVASQEGIVIWNIGPAAAFAEPLSIHAAYVSVRSTAAGQLVAATQDGSIVIADARTGELLGPPISSESPWSFVSVSPDATLGVAFARGKQSSGSVFDIRTGKLLYGNFGPEGTVEGACFDRKGTLWVLTDTTMIPFVASSGEIKGPPISLQGKKPYKIEANPIDGTAAIAFGDGTVGIFDAGRQIRSIADSGDPNGIDDLIFTANGEFLVTRRLGKWVLWDTAQGTARFSAGIQGGTICPAAISGDGSIFAMAENKKVFAWDTVKKILHSNPLEHSTAVTAVTVSRDGQHLFTGTESGTVQQWALPNGDALGNPLQLKGRISSLGLTGDEQLILIATDAGALMISETGKLDNGSYETADHLQDAAWLADYAEALGGQRWLPEANVFEHVPILERKQKLSAISSQISMASKNETALRRFLRWLTADPKQRSISPNRSLTMQDVIHARVTDGSPRATREAAFLSIGTMEKAK